MRQRLVRQLGGLFVLALLVGGVVLFSKLTVDPKLATRNDNLRVELAQIESGNQRLTDDIAEMKREITLLREAPGESLHHARTSLGMVRGSEVVYQFTEPSARAAGPHR